MDISEQINVKGNLNVEKETEPKEQSEAKEKLINELTDMGFSKSLVLRVMV